MWVIFINGKAADEFVLKHQAIGYAINHYGLHVWNGESFGNGKQMTLDTGYFILRRIED